MKKLLLVFACCILAPGLYAQKSYSDKEFEVKFGNPYEVPKFDTAYAGFGFLGNPQTGLSQLSYIRGRNVLIRVFDKELRKIKENSHDISMYKPELMPEGYYRAGNKDYWFYATFEAKEKKFVFWAQEINPADGQLTGIPRGLTRSASLQNASFAIHDMYSIERSADTSKTLICYLRKDKSPDEKINKEEVGFCLLDKDLNVISDKIITVPYTEERMTIQKFCVDNKGNAYMVAKVYEEKKNMTGAPVNYHYHFALFRLGAGQQQLVEMSINSQNHFMHDLFITNLPSNEIVFGAFCTSTPDAKINYDGVYLGKIDDTGNVVEFGKGYYPFTPEILKQLPPEKMWPDHDPKSREYVLETKRLRLNKVFSGTDGSIRLCGEIAESYMDTNALTFYNYDDILVMKILASGEIAWGKDIPKAQNGRKERLGLSYYCFQDGDTTYLFYSDNINNMNLLPGKNPEKYKDGKNGYLAYVKIDGNGNMIKGDLIDYEKQGISFFPAEICVLGNKMLVGRAANDKINQVVLLKHK